ncbi:MAG: NYN domain-containing protein [bacterium]
MIQNKKQTIKKKTKTVKPKESLAIFIDYSNLFIGLRNQNKEIDLTVLREYLSAGRKLLECYIYIAINPNQPETSHELISQLNEAGFSVKQKIAKVFPNGSLKCDTDIEMALDILDFVEKAKPDIIVLVTGDSDFIPLVEKLKSQGIRIEIASFKGIISRELKDSASGYIDIFSAQAE